MEDVKFLSNVLFGFLGLIGFIISLVCLAITVGMSRATHSVHYVKPEEVDDALEKFLNNPLDPYDEDIEKELEKAGKKRTEVLRPIDIAVEEISNTDIQL